MKSATGLPLTFFPTTATSNGSARSWASRSSIRWKTKSSTPNSSYEWGRSPTCPVRIFPLRDTIRCRLLSPQAAPLAFRGSQHHVKHVHLLLQPRRELTEVTRAIKSSSAREANLILHRSGKPFWQDESYDHWVRDAREFDRIRHYIESNPVIAGLVQDPENWPWSSAGQVGDLHYADNSAGSVV